MSITSEIRYTTRQRARFACEYCGASEIDSGGELTIDHHQPISRGGANELDNLIYACPRCNTYKSDYWPEQDSDPKLWNPRTEPMENHLLHLANGLLYPITEIGRFTIQQLRLNRPQLVAYRQNKSDRAEDIRLLARYTDIITLLQQLYYEHAILLEEHRELLKEQRRVLDLLLKR